ncbi:hypothetical protein Pmani_032851 [Petrolisthes manimaculis]|uniref:C2H2-type domain-containing protein n=1 Tax=Petrolisthes manimaculis TaxID=1843537 RepID=A0AAE1NSA8_9EUCA|nr:hypothetical protein Pmani_032851 [Petrolisthes manimaculis]
MTVRFRDSQQPVKTGLSKKLKNSGKADTKKNEACFNMSTNIILQDMKEENITEGVIDEMKQNYRERNVQTVKKKEQGKFNCELCDKTFIQKCNLTSHRDMHKGKNIYEPEIIISQEIQEEEVDCKMMEIDEIMDML